MAYRTNDHITFCFIHVRSSNSSSTGRYTGRSSRSSAVVPAPIHAAADTTRTLYKTWPQSVNIATPSGRRDPGVYSTAWESECRSCRLSSSSAGDSVWADYRRQYLYRSRSRQSMTDEDDAFRQNVSSKLTDTDETIIIIIISRNSTS